MSAPSNWRQKPGIWMGDPPQHEWLRDPEGRHTVWEARVLRFGDKWLGHVVRVQPGRMAPMRVPGQYQTGYWTFSPFSTHEAAIEFIEKWIQLRRSPETWKGPERIIPVGDHYNVVIEDEDLAADWPDTQAGVRVKV
jgi:hypothetical protein